MATFGLVASRNAETKRILMCSSRAFVGRNESIHRKKRMGQYRDHQMGQLGSWKSPSRFVSHVPKTALIAPTFRASRFQQLVASPARRPMRTLFRKCHLPQRDERRSESQTIHRRICSIALCMICSSAVFAIIAICVRNSMRRQLFFFS